MALNLIKQSVGPWPMNTYTVRCEDTMRSVIIDPGDEAGKILSKISDTQVIGILLTHGHFDHIQALSAVQADTNAPVYIHPLDAKKFDIKYDFPLRDGDRIKVGNGTIDIIHTPGHTPGQVCFDLGDGRIIVGDTVFVGGPGKTWSPEEFRTTITTMRNIVFKWHDDTEFFPGHGPSGVIGEQRSSFQTFIEQGWSEDLYGDVTWEE
jgi:glyoxylase-like metal-dependent hydrolase (beta-lactamase superfamily II)